MAWGLGFYTQAQIPRAQDNTERLRREIRLFNLVNGLELSPAQMSLILSRAGEIKALRENFEKSFHFRTYLQENKDIPQEIARRFHALELEQKKARLELDERTQAYAREIEKSFEPQQIYQLKRYVPCIIPPQGESRIGQTRDYKGFAQKLERIRNIPDRLYERRKEIICERTVEEIKLRVGRLPGFDETEIAGSSLSSPRCSGSSSTTSAGFLEIFVRRLQRLSSNTSRPQPALSFVLVLWPQSRHSDRR